ncbi:DUF805 domain-containing protein [Fundidesulfovibrio magnetotacticus]|uniref:DUF805 domain-containing protein n=1 Tax=Fundidesulfovibrio magnetotacticus TaxID=2730080 RepID=UPI0015631EF7|nr:DUF805 domain-containing protein [Fundidesulfovibrio magnetotacticus]
MNLGSVLFSPSGRISREPFWVGFCCVFIVGWIASELKNETMALFMFILTLYMSISVYGKRLHDLGKSSWNQLNPLVFSVASVVFGGIFSDFFIDKNPAVAIVLFGSALLLPSLIYIAYALMVGLPAGMPGDNKYGPNPLEKTAVSAGAGNG